VDRLGRWSEKKRPQLLRQGEGNHKVVGPEKPSRRKRRAESPTFSAPILYC
jgi:hypothetical protein